MTAEDAWGVVAHAGTMLVVVMVGVMEALYGQAPKELVGKRAMVTVARRTKLAYLVGAMAAAW